MHDRIAAEQTLAAEHFPQDDAVGPDIGAAIDRSPRGLLRAHVRGGAEDRPGLRHRWRRDRRRLRGVRGRRASRLHGLREPEVEHLHRAVRSHLDVRRLQVAMNDALLVGGLERLRNLLRDRQCLVDGNRAVPDSVGERRSLDQLHHERGRARALLQAVDGRDVRMVQCGEGLRFTVEPRQAIGVGSNRLGEYLDGHLPRQVGVGCAIHLAHPAHADLGGDFVRAEARAKG